MFTDEHRRNVWDQIRQYDLRAFGKLLSRELVIEAAVQAGMRIGRGPLSIVNLTWLAVAAALHASRNFADLLTLTRKVLADSEGFASTPLGQERHKAMRRKHVRRRSKHDPRRQDPTVVSEEAFTKARRLVSIDFWQALFTLLGKRFEAAHGSWIRWKGFRWCALDGSSVPWPNWKPLARYFGTAKNGKQNPAPQARMVMLQFPPMASAGAAYPRHDCRGAGLTAP